MLLAVPMFAGVWPSGGALPTPLRQGSQVEITWDDALHAERVDVELWDGERRQFTSIARNVSSRSSRVSWVIPSTIMPGGLYRFVVRDASQPARTDFSTGFHGISLAADFATTVEDELIHGDSLLVTPFPTSDRARVAWTKHDAASIEIVDLQGLTVSYTQPASSTRACVVNTASFQSGQYTVILRLTNGTVQRSPLVVTH